MNTILVCVCLHEYGCEYMCTLYCVSWICINKYRLAKIQYCGISSFIEM